MAKRKEPALSQTNELNPKQKQFVAEYLIDLNGKQAAIRAGYSPKTAEAQASRLLSHVKVAEAVAKAKATRAQRNEITADRVLQEMARIAFSDMRRFTTWGPDGVKLRDYEDLTDEEAAAVSEVSQTITEAGGSIKFKLHDKRAALVDLGKHIGLFTEKLDVSTSVRFLIDGLETSKG